jgi:hypothetical protein
MLRYFCFSEAAALGGHDRNQFHLIVQHYVNLGGANNLILRYSLSLESIVRLLRDFCADFCRRSPNFAPSVSDDRIAHHRYLQILATVDRGGVTPPMHPIAPGRMATPLAEVPVAQSTTVGYSTGFTALPPVFPADISPPQPFGRKRGPQTPPGPVRRGLDPTPGPSSTVAPLPPSPARPQEAAPRFKFEMEDPKLDALHNHPLNNCKVCRIIFLQLDLSHWCKKRLIKDQLLNENKCLAYRYR